MHFRLALLLSFALLLAACSGGPSVGTVSGRSASTSSSSSEAAAGSNGYCMPRKHACEKYEKEKSKKNPQQAKIERYYRECTEHNRHCR
ncbi:MAG: hypothetical protein K0Q91_1357 [Fibrobacteria bacterium]|jgi:hypothetical protein|nr:hypothetical protein [Fibrobacteria bacterium]